MADFPIPLAAWLADGDAGPDIEFNTTDGLEILAFDGGSITESVRLAFRLPQEYASAPSLVIQCSNGGAGTAQFAWFCRVAKQTPGSGNMGAAQNFDAANTVTWNGAGASSLVETSISLANFDGAVAGDWLALWLYRDPSDVTDVDLNDAWLLSTTLRFTPA